MQIFDLRKIPPNPFTLLKKTNKQTVTFINNCKLKQTSVSKMNIESNMSKVLEVFFRNPTRPLHIRKVARLVNLSPAAVSKILTELALQGLIMKHKVEVTTEYVGDRDNFEFKWRKRVSNLKQIYDSKLFEYLSDSVSLNSTVILFGSYADGEDWENSDIDIFITKIQKKLKLDKFEKVLGRKISIHSPDLKHVSKEFKINLTNGIRLIGDMYEIF